MINDTKKRIEDYKAALPGLKERVFGVAVLLLISLTMVVSTSFAWITLSRAPEVGGVNTTIAGNGNLEIALVSPDGKLPWESKVGDSSAAEGNTVLNANITWGNLINLSDPSYGLSNIVLRPALLSNASNLLDQPLKGADYGEDGRVELYYNENFQFTNWVEPANGLDGYFKYMDTPQYGVRAISTVQYTYVNNSYYQFEQLMKRAAGEQAETSALYENMIANDDYINALAGLIGDFMTDKLNDKNGSTDVKGYMEDVYNMMLEFEVAVDSFADALTALANAQIYNKFGPETYTTYTYTKEAFLNASATELSERGVSMASRSSYMTIRSKLREVLYGDGNTDTADSIQDFYLMAQAGTTVPIGDLLPYVNELVNINACQILCNGSTYTVGSLGMSAATQLLGKDVDAKITKGVLKDFEQLSGCKMCATDVTVKATYIMTVKMTAKTITTAAVDPYTFNTDSEATEETAAANKGDYTAVAQDTYGMAIDLWVRTNAADSYLTLEGNVLTKTESVRETGVDMNGNTVELYTTTITTTYTLDDGTTESVSGDVAVYKITTDGTDVWYNANNHARIYNEDGSVPEGQTITTPIERYKEVTTVIGYEGENRVWDDNIFLDTDSTTQGSGSCYVFYAEDPAQQERSLRLLSNLRVAFIDCNESSATYGKMIAIAKLDIDNRFEENGKVTLPLVLMDDGSSYLTKTDDGLAIMPLEQNVATRISAVVYLDGREITNSEVLAANDIQGQLNIQFGCSEDMEAMSNEELELATRSVGAVGSKVSGSFGGTNELLQYDYDGTDPLTAYIRLKVEGEQPNNVTAFFMRRVNSTQGSREPAFKLTKGEDGYWYGEYTFNAPGQYVLRTVQLDGVDYDLPGDDYPQAYVAGFTIKSVSVYQDDKELTDRAYTVMTGDNSVSTDLALQFASDGTKKMPSSVRLQYQKDDGSQVTSTLTYNSSTQKWSGTANFTSSGVYTLKYVIMDGEYTELDTQFQRELTIYVGMTVRVKDDDPSLRETTYEGQSFSALMYVEIYDDTDEEVKYLTGARLVYSSSGGNTDADLRWDDTEGCYTCNLQIPGPGIYSFNAVTVGGSVLKTATNVTPVFTCISPEPPSYLDAQPMEGMDYELSRTNEKLGVGIRLKNASAATVTAVLYDADTGKTYRVTVGASHTSADMDGEPISEFYFELPTNLEGYQSGDWTIQKLELINVYTKDAAGNLIKHGESNPLVMELTNSADNDVHVKVVNVKVAVSGTDENLDGGNFMGSATAANPITVTITDQNGNALDMNYISISDLKITYQYKNQSSKDYGGYLATAESVENIELIPASNDGKTFTMGKITLSYAGVFEAKSLSFNVSETAGGTPVSVSYATNEFPSEQLEEVDLPVYTLTTAKPTVTITAVSTNPTTARYYTTTTPSSKDGMLTGSYNWKSDDGYSAVVYMYFAAQSGTLDQEQVVIKYPTVTLGLSGIPTSHSGVTMVFPSGNNTSSTFTFAAGGTSATSTIGAGTDGTFNEGILGLGASVTKWPVLYPAGKQTVSQINVTYGGVVYTVDLSHSVTINNPLCPPYADFVINDSTYTGTVPSRVYSENGETITVTLPTISSWSYSVTDNVDGDYVATGNTTTATVHTRSGNYITKYTYTKYIQTNAEYQAVSSSTTYTVTKQITGWKIGNTVYKPGETVTLTGNQTITAVITTTEGAKTTTSTTATKYYVSFAATGETASARSTPSGYGTQVSAVDAYWTDPTYS